MPPTLLLLTLLSGQLDESFRQDFASDLHPMVELIGDGVSNLTKRQATALLVSLVSKQESSEDVAVDMRLRLHGDFEITLDYELVSMTKPRKGLGAGVKIWCQIGAGNEEPERITLGHLRGAKHDNAFTTIRAQPNGDGKNPHDLKWFDATGKSGKLRLARTGAKLQYQVAEGDSESFRQLREIDVTDRDVFALRFVASRHGATSALSVKLRNADIRANYLLAPGETRVVKRETGWMVVCALLLMVIGGGAGAGWVFREPLRKALRKGKPTEPAE
ncbi:MAG: DUF1583 domain-containing protein [Planctomycetes bacterium]|nr:DUF1583 domain-containing protein [Planctomycetota bacterium]